MNQDAKARIITLLRNPRLTKTDKDKLIDKESLLVLYNSERRNALNERLVNCGLRGAEVQPTHIFFNLSFETTITSETIRAGTEPQLDEIATALQNSHFKEIIIHGHSDARGFANLTVAESRQGNLQLSQDRAARVAVALVERGVSKTHLKIAGHGSKDPFVLGTSLEDLEKNRRVEIEVKPVVKKPLDDEMEEY